jgi:uncharacterized protein YdeI (YjbR/CyaY-like superfamily)
MKHTAFNDPHALSEWFEKHHSTATELWVRIFKKASGRSSVTWNDCVVEAITWGWIDGQKKPLDNASFLQRLTPRKPKSNWSQKNKEHAERLIAEGQMKPSGLRHVQEAKKDGRWESAYEGSTNMTIPNDFLDELEAHPIAKEFFATLDRKNLYSICYRLATAKNPETRVRRMKRMIEQLSRRERFH